MCDHPLSWTKAQDVEPQPWTNGALQQLTLDQHRDVRCDRCEVRGDGDAPEFHRLDRAILNMVPRVSGSQNLWHLAMSSDLSYATSYAITMVAYAKPINVIATPQSQLTRDLFSSQRPRRTPRFRQKYLAERIGTWKALSPTDLLHPQLGSERQGMLINGLCGLPQRTWLTQYLREAYADFCDQKPGTDSSKDVQAVCQKHILHVLMVYEKYHIRCKYV